MALFLVQLVGAAALQPAAVPTRGVALAPAATAVGSVLPAAARTLSFGGSSSSSVRPCHGCSWRRRSRPPLMQMPMAAVRDPLAVASVDWSFIDAAYLITCPQADGTNPRLDRAWSALKAVGLDSKTEVCEFGTDDDDRIRDPPLWRIRRSTWAVGIQEVRRDPIGLHRVCGDTGWGAKSDAITALTKVTPSVFALGLPLMVHRLVSRAKPPLKTSS